MNRERMERAIAILQTVKDKKAKFHMNYWARFTDEEREAFLNKSMQPKLNGCGYAGCAIGFIASDPAVIAEGFHLAYNGNLRWGRIVPVFERHEEYEAAAFYFDISFTNAEYLFSPNNYYNSCPDPADITPEMVITRIQSLLTLLDDEP